uniref:DnaJ homolog subfamily C member 25 n=1 Tax=Ciona intestinalis TaxID=7719 RepID=F7AEF1_CIOIN|nr:dnaJ homolog subfamily C member 25 [Ciona intestinalis]|eukprot:XP_002132082.1 dnaJ homolog subfamily C member 25 [Ciona intestinalis]
MLASYFVHISSVVVILLCTFDLASCQLIPGMYCGEENCYNVLDVDSSASKGEISKAYRKLARIYHPDYLRGRGGSEKEIEEGVLKFHQVATAYETLRNTQTRDEYDYYLQHPEEYYYNYYRYYKRKMPNVDVRVVLFGTVTVISVFQYISWMTSYNTAIQYMVQNSKYRNAAKEEAKSRGLWVEKRKQKKFKTKEDLKQEEDDLIRSIIEEKMDIRGGYQKPEYSDVLWMQIILLPYYIYKFFKFHISWLYNYTIMKKEFTEEDKIYLVCKNLGIKPVAWDMQSDKNKYECMNRELWITSNAKVYIHEKQEEAKAKMANDPRMKRYRRWMNKGGPGRLTFDDD